MGLAEWGASALETLSRLGDWFGLGALVDQAVSETGKVLSTAEVNAYIDKLVNAAAKEGNLKLSQLSDQLNSLLATAPKSNAYRTALQDGINQIRKKNVKAEDIIKAADTALTEAKTHSANIDSQAITQRMDWGGRGKQLKNKAISSANEAANLYKQLETL